MLAAGCAAAILAVIVGIPLLSKLRGDYFALGTLGLGEILRLITVQGGAFTAGPTGILLPSSSFTTLTPHYFIALFLAVFALCVTWYMAKSRIGLALVAIRDDEAAAAASGINILKFKVFAFAVGAFLAGLCGSPGILSLPRGAAGLLQPELDPLPRAYVCAGRGRHAFRSRNRGNFSLRGI
jgi:branched-chain amino acid transport system permease protein